MVILASMIGAVYVAQCIVDGNYFTILLIIILVAGLFYILGLYRYTWQIALLLDGLGFIYAPLGFKVSATEISIILVVALLVMTWWRKDLSLNKRLRGQVEVFFTLYIILTFLLYAAVHFYYFWKNPVNAADYSFSNSLKQTSQICAPLCIIVFVFLKPRIFKWKNIGKTLVNITIIYLIIDIAIRCYSLFIGGPGVVVNGDDAMLFIPGINLLENVYVLRYVAPFVVLLGALLLFERERSARCPVSRIKLSLLIFLGFIGGTLSGGRAVIIACVLFFLIAAVIKKRITLLVLTGFIVGGVISIVNIFPDLIFTKDMPEQVKRSVALIVIDRNAFYNARASIESSTNWRMTLFERALDEWKSSSFVFWVGRDVYAYNYDDILEKSLKGGYEGSMESSLRRGATHNLITDILLTYGLIGAILYYAILVWLILLLFFLIKRIPKDQGQRDIILVTLIMLLYHIIYANVGGGFIPNGLAWLIALCVAMGNSWFVNYETKESPSRELVR
jgi:hypothetical protein